MQTAQQLGRYEILAELGRGAMGAVFRARDPRIDRTVAIKTIAVPGADAKSAEEYRQRFFREAQAAGRLSHPGIVTIFDADEDQPSHTPFIVMEYVDGQTLDVHAAAAPEGRLPLDTAIDLVQQVAAALDYAHASGIIHRDIKPSNIIVNADGRAKIADFGIAKLSMIEATLPGNVLGTPAYMSPEQLSGKPLDGRSDLFSLGVIAYWLVSGEKPFTGESVTEVAIQVAARDPRPATEAAPGLSKHFDYVLARALAKDPVMRYQRGKDLAADLEDVRLGGPPRSLATEAKTVLIPVQPAAQPGTNKGQAVITTKPTAGTRAKRHSTVFYLSTALGLLLLGAVLVAVFFSRTMPASLQIVGQYPFSSGEIYIWVDGDLRYHDTVHRAAAHPHSRREHLLAQTGEMIGVTLPVQAGRHTVRVQVNAPGNIFDHDTFIPGQFYAFSHKTLRVNFNGRNLGLRWE